MSKTLRSSLATVAAFASVSGVAHAASAAPSPGDPFEPFNRAVFASNEAADRAVIRPLAVGYHRIVPQPVRSALGRATSNLGEPVVAVNDLLQGHGLRASRTVIRFALNTTVGLLGTMDVAKRAGLPHHDTDLGVTLARYGVKSGPYLVLPLLGPSTVRDAAGSVGSIALSPLTYVGFPGSQAIGPATGLGAGLELRGDADGQIASVNAAAIDRYAYWRSLYLQHRQSQVSGGKVEVEALPEFDAEPAPVAPPAATASTSLAGPAFVTAAASSPDN